MVDVTLVAVSVLLAALLSATVYAAYEYYRQLQRAQKEYVKAKGMVEDMVLSFNRDLQREADRIQSVSYKVEINSSKADAGLRKAESIEDRMTPLETQIGQLDTQINKITDTIGSISEVNVKTLEKLSNVDVEAINTKLQDIDTSQEALKGKIAGLEEQIQKLSTIPEAKAEAPLPVVPIKRDKAMASLTETEIAVLEFLSSEGPKTAPEIKEKVQLSREHTARLMKKLYEEGYLERETGKLPFKYSVKKDM
jgi:chromosome segregation ATPase